MLLLDDLPMAAALVVDGDIEFNAAWHRLDRESSEPLPDAVVLALADRSRRGDVEPIDRLDVQTGRIERLTTNVTSSGAVLVLRDVVTSEYALRSDLAAANTDPLTGVALRPAVEDKLEELLEAADRPADKTVCVVFLDLDGFKAINDELGHDVGDEVLRVVAHRLRQSTRDHDVVARWGGDEFVVVITDVDEVRAVDVARRLERDLRGPIRRDGDRVQCGASIGFAMAAPNESGKELIARADEAMYRAKKRRRLDPNAPGLEMSLGPGGSEPVDGLDGPPAPAEIPTTDAP